MYRLTERQVLEWEQLYPGLDLRGECRRALAWVNANKGNRKTVGGMPKFLVAWFNRAINRGGARHETVPEPSASGPDPAKQRYGGMRFGS